MCDCSFKTYFTISRSSIRHTPPHTSLQRIIFFSLRLTIIIDRQKHPFSFIFLLIQSNNIINLFINHKSHRFWSSERKPDYFFFLFFFCLCTPFCEITKKKSNFTCATWLMAISPEYLKIKIINLRWSNFISFLLFILGLCKFKALFFCHIFDELT